MIRWALEFERTERYMPQHRNGRSGYSYAAFEKDGGPLGPRLFVSEHAAEMARRSWLKANPTVNPDSIVPRMFYLTPGP